MNYENAKGKVVRVKPHVKFDINGNKIDHNCVHVVTIPNNATTQTVWIHPLGLPHEKFERGHAQMMVDLRLMKNLVRVSELEQIVFDDDVKGPEAPEEPAKEVKYVLECVFDNGNYETFELFDLDQKGFEKLASDTFDQLGNGKGCIQIPNKDFSGAHLINLAKVVTIYFRQLN